MHRLNPVNKPYCLQQICESNYYKLLRLVPDLLKIRQHATASIDGKPPLFIKIVERSRYTVTLELSYFFDNSRQSLYEPALQIRAYLDAKSAEVIRRPKHQTLIRFSAHQEILRYKWRLNYFLEKWLCHCLGLGYRFSQKEIVETALS